MARALIGPTSALLFLGLGAVNRTLQRDCRCNSYQQAAQLLYQQAAAAAADSR